MTSTPEIAIIDPNTLSSLGLSDLLEELIPGAVIRTFPSFAAFMDDTPDMYAHYFISSQVYLEHTAFFLPRRPKTIVLAAGEAGPQLAGVLTLNICQPEKNWCGASSNCMDMAIGMVTPASCLLPPTSRPMCLPVTN